jgi:coproporphyrinogen III oxidase
MEISRLEITNWLKQLQNNICIALENEDGLGKFTTDNWERKEGGGGITKILSNGNVIEKGGVLFSAVHGKAPEFLFTQNQHSTLKKIKINNNLQFFATGVSIVIHPVNPMVPIIHMNVRYFELFEENEGKINVINKWFGGGIDLTPHYIVKEDAKFFHSELKNVCDKHHSTYYSKFKTWADDYFFIKHRNETRGIGGIFFDKLHDDDCLNFKQQFNFWKDVGHAFAPIYVKLINRNKNLSFTEKNKQWQLLRRGRYVEFNLIYDKGTQFGLQSNGRVESILMSLPKLASWEYNYTPEPNSLEEKTLKLLRKEINWV